MVAECEHPDEAYMGKCAICGEMVCNECFQTLFNTMICSGHGDLEDESAWELVGFYTSPAAVEERRYFLDEQNLTSIVVEADENVTELYVPADEKADAIAALSGASDDVLHCDGCSVFYSRELGVCPVCGAGEVGPAGA